eukprot:766783-Hanusia_phi.AAC.3
MTPIFHPALKEIAEMLGPAVLPQEPNVAAPLRNVILLKWCDGQASNTLKRGTTVPFYSSFDVLFRK